MTEPKFRGTWEAEERTAGMREEEATDATRAPETETESGAGPEAIASDVFPPYEGRGNRAWMTTTYLKAGAGRMARASQQMTEEWSCV